MKRILIGCIALFCASLSQADNGFSIDEFTIAANGETKTVQIKMNNDITFSGFQFDLKLPEGVSITKNSQDKYNVVAMNRLKVYDDFEETWTPTHTVVCTLQPSGAYRVMVYSSTSANITGTSGTAVLRMQLTASDQVATGTFTPSFTDIVMSQANETQYKPADCAYTCNVTLSTKVTTLGYASFCWPKALDFTNSGLTAYIATTCNGNSLHLEQVTKVPANTGLILKGTAGSENTYPLETTDEVTDDVSENLLTGTPAETYTITSGDNIYVLSNLDNGSPGFYIADAGVIIPQYKAYLNYPASSRGLTFSFDDDTSGMVNVNGKNAEREGIIYSLQGIRMKSSQAITKRGLYIKDGKKVVLNEAK